MICEVEGCNELAYQSRFRGVADNRRIFILCDEHALDWDIKEAARTKQPKRSPLERE